ncbi:MAG: hypothetical protein J6A69_04720 [Clostridia bacterium]|nr:hypothetical protein [Clostridia bacterium]
MRKILCLLLICAFLLCGCSDTIQKSKALNAEYMGEWKIYTSPVYRDVSIGDFEISYQGDKNYAVEIKDFNGGVDISVVKTMQADEQNVLTGLETINNDYGEIIMKAYLTEDKEGEPTIRLEFVNEEAVHVLEGLYLYR